MPQDLVSGLGSFWLLLGVAVFGLIVWRVYKPSRKREMERHSHIPFDEDRPRDGNGGANGGGNER